MARHRLQPVSIRARLAEFTENDRRSDTYTGMRRLVCALLLATAAMSPLGAAFPRPQGYVNDFAGVLDASTAAELDRLIRETETTTSAEIAVVTVKSLDGMSVEEYAAKLFADWGIGKKARDNGVLVLVAPAERRMRIEVGYGLESILPDALAGRIIREDCLPAFRASQYANGVLQGVQHIARIIERREPATAGRQESRAREIDAPLVLVPFFGVFIAIGAFAAGIGVRTKTRNALLFAALFLIVPLWFVVILAFSVSSLALMTIGVVMAAFGYRKGGSEFWIKTMRGAAGRVDGSSAWIAGSSGGSGGGSSGGSFGGGSSGGGGASGSW